MTSAAAVVLIAAALPSATCALDAQKGGVVHPARDNAAMADDMAEGCSRLTVTQIGGFAGNVALPPLIDLDRNTLDAAGRAAMDDVCRQLAAAAQSDVVPTAIGADLGGYRVEIGGTGGAAKSFSLPGPEATSGLSGQVDVPQLLAPLLPLSGPPR